MPRNNPNNPQTLWQIPYLNNPVKLSSPGKSPIINYSLVIKNGETEVWITCETKELVIKYAQEICAGLNDKIKSKTKF